MAKSSQVLTFVVLIFIVAICASPVPSDTDQKDSSTSRQKRRSYNVPSRKQTEYEIGVLRGYLNNADLYFCNGDPYQGIQCPEEPRCSSWEGVCDGKQVCALRAREQCLNKTRESYGTVDARLCDGDENEAWCYWKNLAPKRCGEDIFLDPAKSRKSANIKSPGFPHQNYPSDLFCFWTVSVPAGRKLSVRVKRFDTEENYDYLSVGHGDDRDDPRSTVIFKHSGSKRPEQREFNSKSNSIWITFRADDWDSKSGFIIKVQDTVHYDAGVVGQNPFNAEPNRECGSTLFVDPHEEMYLESPNYPSFYDNYIECEWIVSTSPGRRFEIVFLDFNTEDGEDFLSVGNGISSKRAPILYKYSGEEPPKKITSRGSDVWFKFSTSLAISRKGFRALLKEKPIQECGGAYIVPSEGSLRVTTEYYPSYYPSNSDCTWRFRNQAGRGLYVKFNDFYTEYGFDLFYFGTGFQPEFNYTNAIIYQHSGDSLPVYNEFIMRVPEAWMKFTTDDLSSLRGFSIEIYDELAAPRSGDDVVVIDEEEQEVEVVIPVENVEEGNLTPPDEEEVPSYDSYDSGSSVSSA
ncbi:bone morphogenetic protein 1-like [Amphiura filiformis]|uniref:bone morphogenetic protein 1-like n=1 Tax=Amphiura filiformis TaxID=82378 RepID=UPI003B2271C2